MAVAAQPMRELVVLGGGISGLSLAYFLRRAIQQQQTQQQPPTRIRVVEAADHVGGWVRTATRDGFLFEEGPRGFRPSRNGAEILRLVEQLDLQSEMRAVDAAAKARYILRDGKVEVRGRLCITVYGNAVWMNTHLLLLLCGCLCIRNCPRASARSSRGR